MVHLRTIFLRAARFMIKNGKKRKQKVRHTLTPVVVLLLAEIKTPVVLRKVKPKNLPSVKLTATL
mgnify:CR=1 FL=1